MASGTEQTNGRPYLKELFGRRLDLIYSVQGEPVQPMSLARILKNIPNILQWQFIQKEEKVYLLKLNSEQQVDQRTVLSELKGILGEQAQINIEYVKEIPVLASGKRKPVVCEWKKDQSATGEKK